jgi:hypothetical protein
MRKLLEERISGEVNIYLCKPLAKKVRGKDFLYKLYYAFIFVLTDYQFHIDSKRGFRISNFKSNKILFGVIVRISGSFP